MSYVDNLATLMRQQVMTYRQGLADTLARLWDQSATVVDIGTFANTAATIALAAQANVWLTTQVGLKLYSDSVTGVKLTDLIPVPMPLSGCREMDPFQEYRWPLARAFKLYKDTGNSQLALDAGRNVLMQLADTDCQLAHINAAVIYYNLDPRIKGYRRVVAGTCDFCEQHQDEYGTHLVMPLHPFCQCSTEPSFTRYTGDFQYKGDSWTNVLVTRPKDTTQQGPTRAIPIPQSDPIPNALVIGAATFDQATKDDSEDD